MNHEDLPQEAQEALKDYVDVTEKGNSVEVVPDPKVPGAYALQVTRIEGKHPYVFHLLWTKGEYDECDFTEWPPVSGDLQFF